ncbi:MAG TPA: hypothetical protein VIL63_05115 [Terriglobales bacterium]
MGGFPGEKNRSLIFDELRNMAVNKAGTEKVGAARAGAVAAPVTELTPATAGKVGTTIAAGPSGMTVGAVATVAGSNAVAVEYMSVS